MKMWAIILALAIGMALLPGFRDKAEITGKVVVTAVGVDVAEGKADSSGVRVSVQAVETMKTAGSLTEQEKNATEVYAVEGRSIAGSMQAFATQTGRGAYILHNKVVALGMEAAKTVPLPRLLDFFMRDHESRPTVNVVICRGKAEELVGMPSASYAIPAEQLANLLTEGERQGGCVRSTLLEVERALSGMADAVLPIVRVEGEEEKAMAVLDGAALFRNGVWGGGAGCIRHPGVSFHPEPAGFLYLCAGYGRGAGNGGNPLLQNKNRADQNRTDGALQPAGRMRGRNPGGIREYAAGCRAAPADRGTPGVDYRRGPARGGGGIGDRLWLRYIGIGPPDDAEASRCDPGL